MQPHAGNGQPRSLADTAAEEAEYTRELTVLGQTEAGRLTSRALQTLALSARAFLFYEPQNEAITTFLEDLREQMSMALRHGAMELDIQPWAISRDAEVVYQERDRERSLSFRLFRDGVRKLTIKPSITWDELVRLLGVFSVRYTGVRQQEDDIVTLL